ncbi:unnamed protein product [Leptidea sinapis]|uniref:Uncharacterized protein n=1 Tax=Leptidea sinapis TaxID=189913 RepID=A0A5E4QPW7_9NEOP|nr:unnamed protein product [Leptidea sinapis]
MQMQKLGMVKQNVNASTYRCVRDVATFRKGVRAVQMVGRANEHHPPPTFTPPELPKKVHVRGDVARDRGEEISLINRNHRSAAPTALLSPMANQLMNSTTTRQVNKVKPNVTRQPPDTPTSRSSGGNQNNNGVSLPAGLADDQSKDFDFEKTEMKYDSTGILPSHWSEEPGDAAASF